LRRFGFWEPYDWLAVVGLVLAAVFLLVGLGWTAAFATGAASASNLAAFVMRRR
jgi:hypothetical protein